MLLDNLEAPWLAVLNSLFHGFFVFWGQVVDYIHSALEKMINLNYLLT
jgi:hypothetical protein